MEKGKIIPGTAQFFERKKALNEILSWKNLFSTIQIQTSTLF